VLSGAAVIQELREQVERLAESRDPVLVFGEAGTGQALCAQAIANLAYAIETAARLAGDDQVIRLTHVVQLVAPSAEVPSGNGDLLTLAEARRKAEQHAILAALGRAGGNRERAAKLLQISQATLYRKLGERIEKSA
jgi:transcriptional regulator with PAS, ATPase and Fis domain